MARAKPDFVSRYGRWALIVGASEGIGRAFALELAARGMSLILVARRAPPLTALADELSARFAIATRAVVADAGAPDLLARVREVSDELEVGLLIYNAALSVVGPFLDASLDDLSRVLDVNCRGPLVMTHFFAGKMVARGRGGVILLSSLSGLHGTALVSTYAASKAFDLVLAEGVAEELRSRGVDVLACVAGATRTPTFERSEPREGGRLARPLAAEHVAREALLALGTTSMWIPGRVNRLAAAAMKMMPRAHASRVVSSATRRMYAR